MIRVKELARLGAIQKIKDLKHEISELENIANGKVFRQTKKKIHWTQKPENQRRVRKMLRKALAAKKEKVNG
jgi:hypothetical protein